LEYTLTSKLNDYGRVSPPDHRISVIVACHNYGRFLKEAIESVGLQTRKADELIVIDDGSTDETSDVLDSFDDLHGAIRIIRHSERMGVVSTYNNGVDQSTGDLIVILDCDDRLSTNYLEAMERTVCQQEVDFAYAGERLFGAVMGFRPPTPWKVRNIAGDNLINTTAMFRRDLFIKIGGFSPLFESLGHEDWDYWVGAAALGATGAPVPDCWIEYRRHTEGSRGIMLWRQEIAAHRLIRKRYPNVVSRMDIFARGIRLVMRQTQGVGTWMKG
jgi:glycosyltransferase involved in cell wall biosynthesis